MHTEEQNHPSNRRGPYKTRLQTCLRFHSGRYDIYTRPAALTPVFHRSVSSRIPPKGQKFNRNQAHLICASCVLIFVQAPFPNHVPQASSPPSTLQPKASQINPCKIDIPSHTIKRHNELQSLSLLCSEHAVRRDRAAVVLGSEVGALGRYERVPLGEESDS